MHAAQYVAQIQATGTNADGWRMFEATGLACVVCPCGANTGFVAKEEALQAYKEHGAGRPLAQPVLMSHTDEAAGTAHEA